MGGKVLIEMIENGVGSRSVSRELSWNEASRRSVMVNPKE